MALARAVRPGLIADDVAARYARRFPRGRLVSRSTKDAIRPGALAQLARLAVRPATLWCVLVAAAIAEWTQALFTFFGDNRLTWFHQDFPALYAAGRLVLDGAGDSLYDTRAIAAAEIAAAHGPVGDTGVLAYFNPPFFALIMSPLARLPLERAYELWTLINLVLLAAACIVVWQLASPLARRTRALFVLALLTLFPLTYGLQIGQFSIILLLSWGGAFVLLRRGHPALAGIALAPLLIKPELLLPVAALLLWKQQWRVFSTLAPLSLVAVGASLWVVGAHNAMRYPLYLLHSTTWEGQGVATQAMFNWSGIVAMHWDLSDSRIALVLVVLLTLLTAGALAWRWRGPLTTASSTFAWQWAALTAATILVDPHLYLQDTIIVAPAAAALLAVAPADARVRLATAALAGWALLALGIFPNGHLGVNAFGLYLAMALVALTIGCRLFNTPPSGALEVSSTALQP